MKTSPALVSQIVIISWWSNCIGLDCLNRLAKFTRGRQLLVVQVGKSDAQKALFRAHLPAGVSELSYPAESPAEHSRVLQEVSLRMLADSAGLWFMDHDVFLERECEAWFQSLDTWLQASDCCLCLPLRPPTPAITQPAFWLSPQRWPEGISSFDPVPFQAHDVSRRPDLFRSAGDLRMPVKDTLVQARDELAAQGRLAGFPLRPQEALGQPLPPFPPHAHLGGLFLLSGPLHPAAFEAWPPARAWTVKTIGALAQFYQACPEAWLAIEEPVLLQRLAEFREAFDV